MKPGQHLDGLSEPKRLLHPAMRWVIALMLVALVPLKVQAQASEQAALPADVERLLSGVLKVRM